MSSYQENWAPPIQAVIPSYLYAQYNDDENLQAFVSTFNAMAQGYLQFAIQNNPGVYTNANISGPFLDFVGSQLYGIQRPSTGTLAITKRGAWGSVPYLSLPYGYMKVVESGSASLVSDDIYKRVLTWFLYLGDGKQMSVPWLKRRIARFLFGADGGDVNVDTYFQVSVYQPSLPPIGGYGTAAYASMAYANENIETTKANHNYVVVIPSSVTAGIFQELVASGVLPLPFQIRF
jgi:hypothetical protein